MKRLLAGASLSLLGLVGIGCGDDPKPTHVEGSYRIHSTPDGCTDREFCFTGDNGKPNQNDCTGSDWPNIYTVCTVNSLDGGAKSVTGYISDQPLSVSNDAGRTGFQIESSVVLDGVTDPYQIVAWDEGINFKLNSREPEADQVLCSTYTVTLLSKDSFQVDFDCPDLRTQFEGFNPRVLELGHIVFTHCD